MIDVDGLWENEWINEIVRSLRIQIIGWIIILILLIKSDKKKCHWRRKREHKFIRSCRNISESINQYNLSNVRGCGVRKKVVRCQIKLFNNKHRQNGEKIGSKLEWWIKMCAVQWLRKNKVKTMKRVSRFSGNGVCV